jgi:hypothetical protein
LLLCTLAVALIYAHVIRTGPANLNGMYDVNRYYSPQVFYTDYALQQGELPLWNALTYCGQPFAANPQTFALYPPNLIRGLLTKDPTPKKSQAGFVFMLGLHYILMAYGVYLLARSHGQSHGAALAAAVAFTFSSLMVRRACAYHFATTLPWVPYILLCTKKVLDATEFRAKLAFAVLAGFLFALSTLGGFLHILPYLYVLMAGYMLLYRMLHPKTGMGSPKLLWSWAGDGLCLLMILGVSILAASVLLIPFVELLGFTARQKGSTVGHYGNIVGDSPLAFFQAFIVYSGVKFEAETLRGSGVIALLLIPCAFTSRQWRNLLLFLVLYLVLLDCSFGPPFPISRLLNWMTPFALSAYARAYDVALLPLSLMVGLGVDAMAQPMRKWWMNLIRGLVVIALAAAMLVPLWSLVTQGLIFLRAVGPWVVYIPAIAVAIMVLASFMRFPKTIAVFVALLIFLEAFVWCQHFVPFLCRGRFANPAGYQASVPPSLPQDNSRRTDPRQINGLFALRNATNGYDPLFVEPVRDVISGTSRGRVYARAVRNWEPTRKSDRGNLFLKRPFWLARQWVNGPLPGKYDLFPAATTVFLQDPDPVPIPELAADDLLDSGVSPNTLVTVVNGMKVFGVPHQGRKRVARILNFNLPRTLPGKPAGPAGAVHSVLRLYYKSTCSADVELSFSDRDTKSTELGKLLNIRSTAGREKVVEIPLPDFRRVRALLSVNVKQASGELVFLRAETVTDLNDEDFLLSHIDRRINSVELDVGPLEEHRMLTYLDAWYPGWEARIDGEPVPIYVANEAFKGIVIPPGTHHVRFTFRPRRIMVGAVVSAATFGVGTLVLIIYLSGWLIRSLQRRKDTCDGMDIDEESPPEHSMSDMIIEENSPMEQDLEGEPKP